MEDLLRQLAQISSTLYQATTPSPSTDLSFGFGLDIPDFLLPFPELDLDVPSPDSLVSTLVKAGAPNPLARELSEIHSKRSAELADQYLQNYRDSCLEISNNRTDVGDGTRTKMYLRLQRTGLRMYKQAMDDWEKEMVQAVQDRCRLSKGRSSTDNRSAFNQDFTPVLEAVFQENAFPSTAVRRALAAKSGMTMNQIKIWFQNHRSRARKNGLEIVKPNSRGTAQKSNRRDKKAHQRDSSPSPSVTAPDDLPRLSEGDGQSSDSSAGPPSPLHLRSPAKKATRSPTLPTGEIIPTPSDIGHTYLLHESAERGADSPEALSDCETVVVESTPEGYPLSKSPCSQSSPVTLVDEVTESGVCPEHCNASLARTRASIGKISPDPGKETYLSFPKPVWTRTPCSVPVEVPEIEVSDLVDAFSKMSISFPDESEASALRPEATGQCIVAGYPLITPTYTAPLPFAVRRSVTPDTKRIGPIGQVVGKRPVPAHTSSLGRVVQQID